MHFLEEERKIGLAYFVVPDTVTFLDTSAELESALNCESFRNMIHMTGYPNTVKMNAVKMKDKF